MTAAGSLAAANRERDDAWLAAGLCLSRVLTVDGDLLARAVPWVIAAGEERFLLPPVGVIVDFGALLHGERAGSRPRRAISDPALASAIRRYEDAVLSRLDADPRVAAGAFALERLPPDLRAHGVGIFVTAVTSRLGIERGVGLQAGIVRAGARRPAREVLERGLAALRDLGWVREELARGYEALVRGAQRAGQLVSDADVFTLENLAILRTLGQRVAIAQIVEARETLERAMPRRIRSTRRATGAVSSRLEDDSAYPVGGFSSISTSGTLENLVTSELVYMDSSSGGQPRGPGAIDLFDMRFTEGELLYYTRDEAIFLRPRRLISFLLGDDLQVTRVKDSGLPWQRVVCLIGMMAAVVKKLERDLGSEALEFRVVFVRPTASRATTLGPERALCELLFNEWVDKGVLAIWEIPLGPLAATLALASRRALVEVVYFSAAPEVDTLQSWSAAATPVGLGEVLTVVTTGLAAPADLETWCRSTVELVASLL
jgi:hypothetical protein